MLDDFNDDSKEFCQQENIGRAITDNSIKNGIMNLKIMLENKRLLIVWHKQEQYIMGMPKHIPVIRKKIPKAQKLYPLDPKYMGPSLRGKKYKKDNK